RRGVRPAAGGTTGRGDGRPAGARGAGTGPVLRSGRRGGGGRARAAGAAARAHDAGRGHARGGAPAGNGRRAGGRRPGLCAREGYEGGMELMHDYGAAAVARARSMPRRDSGRVVRRIADIVGATVLLVLCAPVLALAALAIWIESGRPVLFGHTRLGLAGRPFRCWKLRTMVADAEARLERDPWLKKLYIQNGYKLPADIDPRITRVGRWLRRTYLDEVPQLFNVLGGSMSLVGPRPIVRGELAWYGDAADELL